MQIIKMQFSRCEAMAETGSVRVELKSIIDLNNPKSLLQSNGATTAGFFVRHVLDGKSEAEIQQILTTLSNAFAKCTYDVKRITVTVSYLSDGKGNAVQVTRADGSVQVLSSLVFNSVQDTDTDETMLTAAKMSFANALMSGRYVLTTTQTAHPQSGASGGNGGNAVGQQSTPPLSGDFAF